MNTPATTPSAARTGLAGVPAVRASGARSAPRHGSAWPLALILLLCMGLLPAAAAGELSKDSQACVNCHDDALRHAKAAQPLVKQTEDGRSLSLHVGAAAYLASAHKDQDCTDCHSALDDKTHGRKAEPLESRRALKQAMQDSCVDCHKKKVKLYQDGIHAALVKAGNDKAPLCADCHDVHTQTSAKNAPAGTAAAHKPPACGNCHEDIAQAQAGDVHGRLHAPGATLANGRKAPGCVDCHASHDVKPPSLGEGPRAACLGCHEDAKAQHADWLPNAGLHFDTVACAACHAPNAARRVNLRLVDAGSGQQLREKAGVPQFVRHIQASTQANTQASAQAGTQAGDQAPMGLDEHALWGLLTCFSADIAKAPGQPLVTVRGKLELQRGLQAHQLAPKGQALKSCDTCHAAGAEAFQSVVISMVAPDGRALRHPVKPEVLGSLEALQSVRGFYALGGTRIRELDWLLLLAVVGSLAGVSGHALLRRLMRPSPTATDHSASPTDRSA